MNKQKRILICYYELAEYVTTVLNLLAEQAEVHLIRYPINKEAPFKLKLDETIQVYDRQEFDNEGLQKILQKVNPNLVFVGGWSDKGYLSLLEHLNKDQVVMLAFDNALDHSFMQAAKALVFRYWMKRKFDYCFVPGIPQSKLARKMGFKPHEIVTGVYTANVDQFNQFYSKDRQGTKGGKFLYLGRYIKRKGIFDLWEAFKRYRENGGTWELYCVGTGDEWESRYQGEGVTHFGFKQPNELDEIIKACSVYVLPSHFEPWGVSVHEMAAAGYPMILSEEIGAASQFLIPNENGYSFKAGQVDALQDRLDQMAKLDEEQLMAFGSKSHELAQEVTPRNWVEKVLHLLE